MISEESDEIVATAYETPPPPKKTPLGGASQYHYARSVFFGCSHSFL